MQNGAATVENGLAVSYKVTIYLLSFPPVPQLGGYSREMKVHDLCLYINVHTDVYKQNLQNWT